MASTLPSSGPLRIAILYATHGGFGDVGKIAATLALDDDRFTPTIIGLSAAATEGTGLGADDLDVKGEGAEDLQARVKAALEAPTSGAQYLDIEAPGTEAALTAALQEVDAVVACVGNRQSANSGYLFPGLKGFSTRWCALATQKVVNAMAASHTPRIVLLSSFGIGDDYTPFSGLKVFWRGLLNTLFRDVRSDLYAMEEAVTLASANNSELDYALVRACGLTPEQPVLGTVKVLRQHGDGGLDFSVAKADMARFMLDEAIAPTVHRAAVTVGHPPATAE